VNENFAVAAAEGLILRTSDGGTNWISQWVDMDPWSVSFADINNGLVVGDEGIILRTTDGGEEWFQQMSNTTKPLLGVSFIDTDHAVVVGDMGIILRTNTGGFVPVELTSFSAYIIKETVQLSWTTSIETNNRGFEIQRSSGSRDYITIGFVRGNGTTTEQHNYLFRDKNLNQGSYSYRLKQYDFDGSFQFSDVVDVDFNIPVKFALEQNFPNPFNPTTIIKWQSPESGVQTLKIYDVLGNEVKTLIDEYRPAGVYEINFDASNLASGVYYYRIESGSFTSTKKMILLR